MKEFRITVTYRDWVPTDCEKRVRTIATQIATSPFDAIFARIQNLAVQNRTIHEEQCFNLNPATNVMNPKAEALLSSGIGSRSSLGSPDDKYEMGTKSIEEIEVTTAQFCALRGDRQPLWFYGYLQTRRYHCCASHLYRWAC